MEQRGGGRELDCTLIEDTCWSELVGFQERGRVKYDMTQTTAVHLMWEGHHFFLNWQWILHFFSQTITCKVIGTFWQTLKIIQNLFADIENITNFLCRPCKLLKHFLQSSAKHRKISFRAVQNIQKKFADPEKFANLQSLMRALASNLERIEIHIFIQI